jgi:hypothetical protein
MPIDSSAHGGADAPAPCATIPEAFRALAAHHSDRIAYADRYRSVTCNGSIAMLTSSRQSSRDFTATVRSSSRRSRFGSLVVISGALKAEGQGRLIRGHRAKPCTGPSVVSASSDCCELALDVLDHALPPESQGADGRNVRIDSTHCDLVRESTVADGARTFDLLLASTSDPIDGTQ